MLINYILPVALIYFLIRHLYRKNRGLNIKRSAVILELTIASIASITLIIVQHSMMGLLFEVEIFLILLLIQLSLIPIILDDIKNLKLLSNTSLHM